MPTLGWYATQAKIDAAYELLREAAGTTDNPVLGQVILDTASIVNELGNYSATGQIDTSAVSTSCVCAECIVARFTITHAGKGD